MNFYVFNKSIVGYKNKINNKSSQDYLEIESMPEGLICTIADGHSGDFFTHSHKGSKFACKAAIEVIKKYINKDMNEIEILLKEKVLQKEICDKWRYLVSLDMKENLPSVFKYNTFKYGTTLLLVLIKENYILYMKLGDGDILLKKHNKIENALPVYKKNIVESMSQEKSYEKIIYKIEKNEKDTSDIIIFSDGFENSFVSYDDMIEDINNTIIKYKKSIFSKYLLEKNYDKHLIKLSENRSLDDISIIFINLL